MKKRAILVTVLAATLAHAAEPVKIPGTNYKRQADVIYGRKHGTALTMDVIIPPKQNGAAIIYAVSSGFSSHHSWVEGAKFPKQISILLDRGYTVFAVVHGSVPKFTIREVYGDIRRAIRYIRHHAKNWNVDPGRFGMTGVSAGGVISLMMGTDPHEGDPKAKDPVDRESTRIQAVACFCPASDLVNFEKEGVNVLDIAFQHRHAECYKFRDYDPKTRVYTPITDEKRIHALLVEHSPITHVTKDDAPTLIVHGEKDALVTWQQQAKPIIDKLKAAGVEAELVVAKDKKHGGINIWQKEVKRIADWFDKHLQPKPGNRK